MSSLQTRGSLVATALYRAWRLEPPAAFDLTPEQLAEVTPLLYESSAGALGWWRIRKMPLRETSSGELLHQAYRLLVLHGAMHERQVQKVFRSLRAAGIEPILIKGWAVARLYPEVALRPYGDVDILVRRRDRDRAEETVDEKARDCFVDLHSPAFELADRSLEDLFLRSQLVQCGDEQVRVLSPEDHFALLAVHLLKHGAWRPVWLCDLALLLENMTADFKWDVCLGEDSRRANWILSAAGLAHKLLGAEISDSEHAEKIRHVPEWLVAGVLKQWETPFAIAQPPMSHRAPINSYLTNPLGLFGDLRRRWPNPILATVSVNGIFAARPRRRYQFENCRQRLSRWLMHGSGAGRPLAIEE
jgi:Uncharacterised nucleotidyltransferase